MSILIKGMKMPKHCMDCPFVVSRDNDDCILQSAEANGNFENWEQMKARCPLVEVPTPHGRLIDAKKLECDLMKERTKMGNLSHISKDFKYMEQAYGLNMARLLSIFQQTIIEAEGEGEDV